MSDYRPRSREIVLIENELQYGEVWPLSADMRREHTLKYAVPKRNMWKEMADVMVSSGVSKFVDFGSCSGYLMRQALESGYSGEIIGVEKEGNYLPLVEQIIRSEFPDANFTLMEADAQQLELEDNSTEGAMIANISYHVPDYLKLFSEASRIVVPNGIIVPSTKGVDHQEEIWMFANCVGARLGASPIHSFYWHCPPAQMRRDLEGSKNLRVIEEVLQISESLIPDDEEEIGWNDLKQTVFTLVSLMRLKNTGLPPPIGLVNDCLESREMKELLFKRQVRKNGGSFKGKVRMAYWVCENIK